MNRSILIVICDFLLVSLLAFSTVDVNRMADPGGKRVLNMQLTVTNQAEADKDLTAVMRLALAEERKNKEQILSELARTRETAQSQQTLLSKREQQAQELQQQAQALQQQLHSREELTQRLQTEQSDLQRQFAAAQTNLDTLNQQLHATANESVLSREKLAAMEAEAKKQAEQASALQQQLAQVARSNQMVLAEKQQLYTQLQVAEAEKRNASDQVTRMTEEVKVERQEKAKLAEGVQALAAKSTQLAQEIRENTPLAPNTVFNEFSTNAVRADIAATRSAFLGIDSNRRNTSRTVLATDGTNLVAICHVQDTPLALFNPGTEWESLTGTLSREGAQVPIRSLSFHLRDPRVVLMPVTAAEARQLGGKVYHISSNPFKFQDAVLVGTRDNYYGECKFQIDLATPEYLKLDHNFIKGIFGKFNPSSGDLVFSKTGELLGLMANNTYCLMLHDFDTAATLNFGQDVRAEHTGNTLSLLYWSVAQLPVRLQ